MSDVHADALVKEFSDIFRIKRGMEASKTYEMPKKYLRMGKTGKLSSVPRKNLAKIRDAKMWVWN